jgi:hypothetical protein
MLQVATESDRTMKAQDRDKRDAAIMKLVRAGMDALDIAKQHRLTLNRINQIIERERCKSKRSRHSQSRARAATAERRSTSM